MEHTQFAALLLLIMILVSVLSVFINRYREKAFNSYARELYRREKLRNAASELKRETDAICGKYLAIKKPPSK